MTEPFYVRQSHEITTETAREWLDNCCEEARQEGANFLRVTFDNANDPKAGIVEGWKEKPDDQGEPRWAYTENNLTDGGR